MGADSIPEVPLPLAAEQAERMSQRQIKKHHVAMMLLHWFNAVVWLAELITGTALGVSSHYRVMPYWYLHIVEGVFGTKANMLLFHITVGVTWIVVFAVYAVFGFRTYIRTKVLHGVHIHEQPLWRRALALQCILFQSEEVCLDADDLKWLWTRALRMLGRSHEPLPPQGIYNAGQKLFAWLVYLAIPVIMATGLVMSYHLIATTVVAWAIVLHFLAVGFVVSGLMIHVYMGAVFPEEKPAFFSMITGMVNELYAYRHHLKWWKEVKIQEREWKEALEKGGGKSESADTGSAPAPSSAASGTRGPATSSTSSTRRRSPSTVCRDTIARGASQRFPASPRAPCTPTTAPPACCSVASTTACRRACGSTCCTRTARGCPRTCAGRCCNRGGPAKARRGAGCGSTARGAAPPRPPR